MLDTIELRAQGQKIQHFERYRVEGDLYCADHAFEITLANPEIKFTAGMPCEIQINGSRELYGILDCVNPSGDKDKGRKLKVAGRDLMGYFVDAYCETFQTLQGVTLQQLTQSLLKNIPKQFRGLMNITYQQHVVGVLLKKQRNTKGSVAVSDFPQAFSQIEPGMTIFEVLKEYAQSRGMMFFCDNHGDFTFGRPKAGGAPLFNIVNSFSGQGNNVLEWELHDNISRRYSQVTVAGQKQGEGSDAGPSAINVKATVTDPAFPFYKPFVQRNNNDRYSPKLQARFLMEKLKADGFRIRYKVAGHSQNGHNWQINELVKVQDEPLGLNGNYLVYRRTFMFDKQRGPETELILGYPGLIAGGE
ncbi:MAG: hypothetical protein M0Z48_00655 [Nitrospiraceae bacterium]|nr:hypothetical protein [Nitrospiraceae bacterium]